MMEAARTSKTLVNFYQTTWRSNPEDSHLQHLTGSSMSAYLCVAFYATLGPLVSLLEHTAVQQQPKIALGQE
jgi:hypothetical protein